MTFDISECEGGMKGREASSLERAGEEFNSRPFTCNMQQCEPFVSIYANVNGLVRSLAKFISSGNSQYIREHIHVETI